MALPISVLSLRYLYNVSSIFFFLENVVTMVMFNTLH